MGTVGTGMQEVISPDFFLKLTGFFQGKHLIHFLVLKMKDFRNFVLHNCILVIDAEQVYSKLQVINLKINPSNIALKLMRKNSCQFEGKILFAHMQDLHAEQWLPATLTVAEIMLLGFS